MCKYIHCSRNELVNAVVRVLGLLWRRTETGACVASGGLAWYPPYGLGEHH